MSFDHDHEEQEPRLSMDEIEKRGETVFQNASGGCGGLWGLCVSRIDGEYWAYDSGDRVPDGPFEDLRDALWSNETGYEFLAVGSSTEGVWAEGIPTDELIGMLDISWLEPGDWLYVNGVPHRVEVAVIPLPVSRKELLRYFPGGERERVEPPPRERRSSTVEMIGWAHRSAKARVADELSEIIRRGSWEEIEQKLAEVRPKSKLLARLRKWGHTRKTVRRRDHIRLVPEERSAP